MLSISKAYRIDSFIYYFIDSILINIYIAHSISDFDDQLQFNNLLLSSKFFFKLHPELAY